MILYFMNDSKQKKKLLESDYVEDIYDVMEAFFEEHRFRPHFIRSSFEEGWKVTFGSMTECFVIEGYSETDIEEAKKFLQKK